MVHLRGLHPVCASRVSRKVCYARGFEPWLPGPSRTDSAENQPTHYRAPMAQPATPMSALINMRQAGICCL